MDSNNYRFFREFPALFPTQSMNCILTSYTSGMNNIKMQDYTKHII